MRIRFVRSESGWSQNWIPVCHLSFMPMVEPSKLNLSWGELRKDDTKMRESSPEKDYHSNKTSSFLFIFARCWVLGGVVYLKNSRLVEYQWSIGSQIPNVRRSLDPKNLTSAGIWKTRACVWAKRLLTALPNSSFCLGKKDQWSKVLVMSCTVAVHWGPATISWSPVQQWGLALPAWKVQISHFQRALGTSTFPEPLGAYSSNRGFHMPGSPSWSFRQACCKADAWRCCHRRAGHCIHNLQWACHTKTSLPPNLFGKSMRLLFMPWLIPPTTDKAVAIQFLRDAYFHQITLIFVMSTAPCSPTCWYLKSWFFKLVFGMFWQN